jgi:4-hydroxy-3-methylbut-2-enyl diphosphate reductase IspH
VTKPTRLREDEDDEEEEEEIFLDHDESHDEEDDDEDEVGTCSTTSTVLLEKNRELDAIAMKLQRTIFECEKTTKRLDEREGILLHASARNLRTLRERTNERCRKRWKARRRVRWSAGF